MPPTKKVMEGEPVRSLITLLKFLTESQGEKNVMGFAKGAQPATLDETGKQIVQSAIEAHKGLKGGVESIYGSVKDFFKSEDTFAEVLLKMAIYKSTVTPGASRFADTSPMGASTAAVKAGAEAGDGLVVIVKGKTREVKGKPKGGALMPGEFLFDVGKATKRGAARTGVIKDARKNLVLGLERLAGKKRNPITQAQKERVLQIFDGLMDGTITSKSEGWSEMVRGTINILARDKAEGEMWAASILGSNLIHEIDVMGKKIIIPEATEHGYLYQVDAHVPEEGTTVQTAEMGAFYDARGKMKDLRSVLDQYPQTLEWLAEAKSGLFGEKALQRLQARLELLGEIESTPNDLRETLFENAVADGILPKGSDVALEEGDGMDALMKWGDQVDMEVDDEIEEAGVIGDNEVPSEVLERSPDDHDLLADRGTSFHEEEQQRIEGIRLSEQIEEETHPMQRLLDLHSTAISRDAAILMEVFRTVGAMPENERQAYLDKLPDLAQMEKRWTPTEKGMSSADRLVVFKEAGLQIGGERPMLELPASVIRRQARTNAVGLLTARKAAPDRQQMAVAILDLVRFVSEGNDTGVLESISALETILKKPQGSVLEELASGQGRLFEIVSKHGGLKGEEANRLVEIANKHVSGKPTTPGSDGEGFRPDPNKGGKVK